MTLINKTFRITFLFLFLGELLSLWGYIVPNFNGIVFLFIVILATILTFFDLKYGVWILFAELFVGSKGYLFFYSLGDTDISIRIALWVVVMSTWFGKTIAQWIKNKKLEVEFFKSDYVFYYLFLSVTILWGIVNGFLSNNSFDNIFFDFNGWLYFLIIFPVFEIIKNKENINYIFSIFTASITWLSVKTFFLLFVFSHNLIGMVFELYRWVRVTGVGEITQMQGGFSRIFFQSHIFVLIGFFLFLLLASKNIIEGKTRSKDFLLLILFLTIFLSVVLIGFSRSFWVGFIFGLVCFFVYLIWQKVSGANILRILSLVLIAGVLSLILIAGVVKFPYPSHSSIDMTDVFSKRISELNESAISSRWALLPELWNKVNKSIVLGSGMGTTVTYKSSDPRVLESNITGEFTTYAFEWGWLDIWLKLGIFGVIAYLGLFYKIFTITIKRFWDFNVISFTLGLAIIFVVSFFSPYLNHPLGIGYLILVTSIIRKDPLP